MFVGRIRSRYVLPSDKASPAQVLLEVHNTHHYQRWFAELRRVIVAGRLGTYSEWFLERRRRATLG